MGRGALILIVFAACRMGFDEIDVGDVGDDEPTIARVTIEHVGGLGTIVGPDGFTCNSGTCTIEVDRGTALTLRGLAATSSWFVGWTSVCGGNFDCSFVADEDVTIVAAFTDTPNRAFVTSTTTTGGIGGVVMADSRCAARATAAGLSGTFIAFVSDSGTNAPSRLTGSRGWVRVVEHRMPMRRPHSPTARSGFRRASTRTATTSAMIWSTRVRTGAGPRRLRVTTGRRMQAARWAP